MPQLKLTADILAAAMMGFEVQKFAIEGKIAEIRLMLDGDRSEPAAPSPATRTRRKKRSAAVRRKMALAQRARYAKLKQGSEPTQAVAPKPKRKLSAAARKRIAAAQKKRWAAIKVAVVNKKTRAKKAPKVSPKRPKKAVKAPEQGIAQVAAQ
jgi:hypothetical protein